MNNYLELEKDLPNIKSFGIGNAAVGLQACRWIRIIMGAKNSIDPFSQINKNAIECLEKSHSLDLLKHRLARQARKSQGQVIDYTQVFVIVDYTRVFNLNELHFFLGFAEAEMIATSVFYECRAQR